MPYNDPHPHKDKARMKLMKAVQKGVVYRPKKCENCLLECTPQGHHNDYSKPLEAIWLCPDCHKDVHRMYGGIYTFVDINLDSIVNIAKLRFDTK